MVRCEGNGRCTRLACFAADTKLDRKLFLDEAQGLQAKWAGKAVRHRFVGH